MEVVENIADDFLRDLLQTKNSFWESQKRIAAAHPSWDNRDARLTVFIKCFNVLSSAYLGLIYARTDLANEYWWLQNIQDQILKSKKDYFTEQYMRSVRIGFIQCLISALESSFRPIVKVLDPNACRKGTAEFQKIYECLLKQTKLEKWEPLLDLLRIIRNTIHNNGLYLPPSGKDVSVAYKGMTYEFRVGQRPDVTNWPFLVDLANELRSMLMEIVTNVCVVSLTDVPDPIAYLE
jgi:hypothetical protein